MLSAPGSQRARNPLSPMQPSTPDKIIYEHPLNEKTRTILRLEHLFREFRHHLACESTSDSRCAIAALLDCVNIFGRADIKADLIKELDRHRGKLAAIAGTPGVDASRLEQILRELEQMTQRLHGLNGQIGQELRDNEFLKSVMQRSSIPGGTCAFDLPLYHYWLKAPLEKRREDLSHWFRNLEPIHDAVTLLLSLVRGSTRPSKELAESGFFQRTLDAQSPAQLIRVGLPADSPYLAEISGGKHRFSVRFLKPSLTERPAQTREDVSFLLNCCIL